MAFGEEHADVGAEPEAPASGEAAPVADAAADTLPEPEPAPEPKDPATERDEYLALAQRTQADFENFRKRAGRDAAQAEVRGVGRLAKELLPALDHLVLALAAAQEAQVEHDAAFLEGIRLVQSELVAALARAGVETIFPAGEVFDPNQHEAVAQQPAEGVPAGTVAQVYQQGYRLGEHVLRPARVIVAS